MVTECTITVPRAPNGRRETGGGEEEEGYEVRGTADRGSVRMGGVENL